MPTEELEATGRETAGGRTLNILVPVELFIPDSLWEQIEQTAMEIGITPEDLAAKAISAGLSMTHGVG